MASLVLKAAVGGAVSLALILGCGTAYLTEQIGTSFQEQAQKLQSDILIKEANAVGSRLEVAAKTAEDIAVVAGSLKAEGVTDRGAYDSALRSLAEANPSLLGTWTGWEPDALDGKDRQFAGTSSSDATGRFLPYWNRGNGTMKREALTGYDSEADGAYYQLPKKLNRPVAVEPYSYVVAGKDTIVMSFGVPISVRGKFVGVGGVDIDLGAMSQSLSKVRPFGVGYVTIASSSGIAVSHPDAQAAGKPLAKFDVAAATVARQAVESGKITAFDAAGSDGASWRFLATPIQAGGTTDRWAMVVGVPSAALSAAADEARRVLTVIAAFCILASCAVLSLLIWRLVGTPTRALTANIHGMSMGNYDAPVPEAARRDEIGSVGQAVVSLWPAAGLLDTVLS